MKKILSILLLLCGSISFSQNTHKEPLIKAEGDLVAITTYHDNGAIKEQGFYKNKKLHGEWNKYDERGVKITKANYRNGKKVGTWLFLNNGVVSEVDYIDGRIASVHNWDLNNI